MFYPYNIVIYRRWNSITYWLYTSIALILYSTTVCRYKHRSNNFTERITNYKIFNIINDKRTNISNCLVSSINKAIIVFITCSNTFTIKKKIMSNLLISLLIILSFIIRYLILIIGLYYYFTNINVCHCIIFAGKLCSYCWLSFTIIVLYFIIENKYTTVQQFNTLTTIGYSWLLFTFILFELAWKDSNYYTDLIQKRLNTASKELVEFIHKNFTETDELFIRRFTMGSSIIIMGTHEDYLALYIYILLCNLFLGIWDKNLFNIYNVLGNKFIFIY